MITIAVKDMYSVFSYIAQILQVLKILQSEGW